MHDFYTFCPKLKPPTTIAQEARVQKKRTITKIRQNLAGKNIFIWLLFFETPDFRTLPEPTTQKTLRIDSTNLRNSNELI